VPDPATTRGRSRRPLLMLLLANGISGVGNNLTALAVPWFVLETTGSPTRTGITGFFTILPIVLASFFGGTLVDRLGFRRMSVLADAASGITVALIPLLYRAGLLEFWLLLVLVFLGALLDAPGATARAALVPDLAELGGVGIERAAASVQVVQRAALLLGAPLAGGLIALLGASAVLWLDAVTFAVSALMVQFLVPATARPPRTAPPARYRDEMSVGIRFIRQDRLTLALLLVLVMTNFLDSMWSSVLAPVYAQEVYDSAVALGLLFGAAGGGAVLGAIAYGAVGHRLPRRTLFIAAFVVAGAPALVLATFPPLPVAVAIKAVAGIAAGPLNPILGTLQYERIPAPLRGRVLGVMTAAAWVAMPLGALIAGPLLAGIGLRATLLAVGGCYVATTLSMLVTPAIREMDVPVTDPSPA